LLLIKEAEEFALVVFAELAVFNSVGYYNQDQLQKCLAWAKSVQKQQPLQLK
jgi:hypothetical protein